MKRKVAGEKVRTRLELYCNVCRCREGRFLIARIGSRDSPTTANQRKLDGVCLDKHPLRIPPIGSKSVS